MIISEIFKKAYNKLWIFYLILPFIVIPSAFTGKEYYIEVVYDSFKEYYLAAISLFIFSCYLLKFKTKIKFPFSRINFTLLILYVIFLIGSALAKFELDASRVIFGFTFFYIIYLYAFSLDGKEVNRFLFFLIVVGVIQSLIAITQYIGLYYNIIDLFHFPGRMRILGTIGNVNKFSHFVSFIFLISVFLSFFTSRKKYRNFFLISSWIMFYTILISQTRASWLGLFIVSIFILSRYRNLVRRKKAIVYKLLLGLLVVTIIFILTTSNFHIAQSVEINNLGFSGRLTFWKIALKMIGEKPITGFGTGSFRTEAKRIHKELDLPAFRVKQTELFHEFGNKKVNINYKLTPVHTHNEYLQIFAENGIFGFVIMIYLIFHLSSTFLRSKYNKIHLSLFFYPLIFMTVISFFSFPLHTTYNGMLCFFFLGCFDRSIVV